MSFFRFSKNDVLINRIKTHPNLNLKIYNRIVYYNNELRSGTFDDFLETHNNKVLNINPFVTKDGSLTSFKTVSTSQFNSDFNYGDTITGSYSSSIRVTFDRYVVGQSRPQVDALRNAFNSHTPLSPHYAFSSNKGNKLTQELKLIGIPNLFYGSSIEKGSVSCKFYVTGTLAAELVDNKGNGELRQKLPQDSNSGSVAGVVLYKEGLISLTGSWSIHPTHTERYDIYAPTTLKSPRWLDFGTTGSSTLADLTNVSSSSFELDFNGTNFVPVITLFAHAPKGQLNYSNNPTFLTKVQSGSVIPHTSSTQFIENDDVEIKNVVRSNFIEPTASFDNVTYLSQIGIYDKNRNLIGVAKLAQPIKKLENNAFTVKMKIDL